MKAIFAIVCCGLIAVVSLIGEGKMVKREDSPPKASSQQEARWLWEQAIAAKGGREQLRTVRNLVVTHRGDKAVSLYVFPYKLWQWNDDRETPIGLAVTMLNLQRDLGFETRSQDAQSPMRMDQRWRESTAVSLQDAQLYYLMETEWMKPAPIGVTSGQVGSRRADVVQTTVNGKRVDFYFDQESHLPLKVAFPVTNPAGTYYVTFSDYANVNGIKMPRRVRFLDSGNLPTNFEINVTYDESIFERPPRIEAGPEAWRRRP
jgi:hypothetical protein